MSPSLSAALAFLTLLVVFFLIALIFVPLIMEEARIFSSINKETLNAVLQKPIAQIETILQNLNISFENVSIQTYLQEKLMSILTVTNISLFINQFLQAMGDFFVAVFAISFFTFFFLRDEKIIAGALLAVVPENYSEKIKNVLYSAEQMLRRYFIGILIEVLFVVTFLFIGLLIAGIKYALLIALFAGIVNVIPYIGPLIGTGFALLVGLTTIYPEMSIASVAGRILILFPSVYIADAFFLQPFIYSRSVKAHPLEIFLVILIGATMGEIGGMLLAVPSYTVIRVIVKELNQRKMNPP